MYKKIKCAEGQCYYLEYGQKNKNAIVFLHGYSDSAKLFKPLRQYLENKYHVIIPDLPMIRRKAVSYDLTGLSSFINEVVENLRLKRFILCGFSFGGLVAADYSYWFPKKVEKLYLLNSVPRFLFPEILNKMLLRIEPREVPSFIYSFFAFLRTTKVGKKLSLKTDRLEETIRLMSRQPFAILGTLYEVIWYNIVGGTWSERVKKFKKMSMPKFVVLFKDDKIISYKKYAQKLKRSGVNVITFKDGGHAKNAKYWDNLKTLF